MYVDTKKKTVKSRFLLIQRNQFAEMLRMLMIIKKSFHHYFLEKRKNIKAGDVEQEEVDAWKTDERVLKTGLIYVYLKSIGISL